MIRIYHNNRCSKSRAAVQFFQDRNLPFETIYYLENPLSSEQLTALLRKLGMTAEELVRKNEPLFKESFRHLNLSEKEWIELLCKHPSLIERPIVEWDEKAIVARPTTLLEDFFQH